MKTTTHRELAEEFIGKAFTKEAQDFEKELSHDTDFWWLNSESRSMLERGYLLEGEDVSDAVERICKSAADHHKDLGLKEGFERLIKRGWMSLSSPVWANMGTERGLPISCFNVYVPDNIEGITNKIAEVIMQTKLGGGTSGYFGALRPKNAPVSKNGKSSGAVSFMNPFESITNTISQGGVRRGAFAAYLDIEHEDIEEFIKIRDHNSELQNIHFGVCISDAWIKDFVRGDEKKVDLWKRLLKSRKEKGEPYIFFTDNANKNKPVVYKEQDMKIYGSNLCSEIMLPSNEKESFVCCLSSMNLELYDEWKDTDAVKLSVYFLDAVLTEFIKKTKGIRHMKPARRFAKRHRAIGLGVLGWHAYLQKNNIAFESLESKQLTNKIFRDIQNKANITSRELALSLGEPKYLKGYNIRHTTTMAIAPTTSSASILGQTSPGIEPINSNYYKVELAKGYDQTFCTFEKGY
uniref:Putative ribonucleoside-diphosphate reductase large subunit n=1 Tax=Stylophora pistillata TaxID=50429 RepID=A0A2B4R692_STYPI